MHCDNMLIQKSYVITKKQTKKHRSNHCLFFSQELDYGALYEVRTPHFYVEANKMLTARVSESELGPLGQPLVQLL